MPEYKIQMIDIPGTLGDIFFRTTTSPVYLNIKSRFIQVVLKDAKAAVLRIALEPKTVLIHYDTSGGVYAAELLTVQAGFMPIK
ncbi:unnamed protein product, partial [Allacma fusca]